MWYVDEQRSITGKLVRHADYWASSQTRVGPGDPHLDPLQVILIQAQVQKPLDNQCSFLWEVSGEYKFLLVMKVSRAVRLLPVTSLLSQQNMGFGVSRPGL